LNEIIQFLLNLVDKYGYFGAFLGSLLGNITIALPTPYAFLIMALGSTLNPLILGFVSGLGATIGELSSYVVGRASRKALSQERLNRLAAVRRLVDKYGFLTIILFAVTPLPDDVLLVSLGMMNYNVKSLVLPVWIGKTILATFLAYAGLYGFTYLSSLYVDVGWSSVFLTLLLLSAVIIVLLKIDWEEKLSKL
jgi:membrane protein DedA with SNARE-associated domain